MGLNIALFGESEKGEYNTAYYCTSMPQLCDFLGEPPHADCQGLPFAIQALLNERGVIFFRVHEEGFSTEDYLFGLQFLENKKLFPNIAALCLPGVGNAEIIDATSPICTLHKSLLIVTERDFYDYLMTR